ncbi:hypothetical protein [Paraburkholderia xenovorans]|jgi:hypothetical protein
MESIWMQYNDEAMTEPCGWSFWEQPLETWPYQKEVAISNSEYAEYYAAQPIWAKSNMPAPVAG